MKTSKWQGLAAIVAALMVLTACSPVPEEDAMPTPQPSTTQGASDPNPSEPISELVTGADVIAFGTVESVDPVVEDAEAKEFPAQTAVVRVDDVLKGDAAATITVSKPAGTTYYLTDQTEFSYDSRHEGIFVLTGAGEAGYELFGNLGVHDDWGNWQKFERVLAGLPEHAPAATKAELAAWTAQADIIVFASARGDADDIVVHTPPADYAASATLTPIEVLKGDMPEPLDVVQGPQPDVAGGTWAFPVKDEGQTGVFFIDTSSGTPTVINTTNPSVINRRKVPVG
ncbi:hypothetical protein [Microbacterium aurantiacum]|uniref:hypothetical protein n=1 Tax=Microbacterium aurantiacum TaxID=162393 RepID=UPI000C7F9A88|nr:hypothetical protein [Microbacterium aurantiacum]